MKAGTQLLSHPLLPPDVHNSFHLESGEEPGLNADTVIWDAGVPTTRPCPLHELKFIM